MNKILLIIKREYLTRVRKRIFIITTLLAPLSIAVVTFLPIFLARHGMEDEKIALYDASKIFSGEIENRDHLVFGHINTGNVPLDSLKAHYADMGFKGILYIPADFTVDMPVNIEFVSNKQLGIITKGQIENQMNELLRKKRLEEANISPEVMEKLNMPVRIEQTDELLGIAETSTWLGYGMGFMIYIVLLIYGTMVMRGVMEEKNNRIAEVIVSSVKPFQLMMGKITGIALVGLTQFLIWIILSAVIMTAMKTFYAADISTAQQISVNGMQGLPEQNLPGAANFLINIEKLPLGLITFGFVFFFLGGYLLYASIFAAIGAASGEEGDQSLTFVATIPIIISIILLISVLNQPDGKLAVITSFIPFFSPIIMAGRLPFVPPGWQIALSAAILVVGFLAMVWIAGKIYRTGILMYGKKGSLKEMMKWIKY